MRRMNSDDLKKWQLLKMRDDLGPAQRYLNQMVRRMEKRGFPLNDAQYLITREAQAAVQRLSMELDYLSGDSGVGRPPRKPETDSLPQE